MHLHGITMIYGAFWIKYLGGTDEFICTMIYYYSWHHIYRLSNDEHHIHEDQKHVYRQPLNTGKHMGA